MKGYKQIEGNFNIMNDGRFMIDNRVLKDDEIVHLKIGILKKIIAERTLKFSEKEFEDKEKRLNKTIKAQDIMISGQEGMIDKQQKKVEWLYSKGLVRPLSEVDGKKVILLNKEDFDEAFEDVTEKEKPRAGLRFGVKKK